MQKKWTAELKADLELVRASWENPSHVYEYAEAVTTVGLWDSERLLVSKYFFSQDQILDIGCGAGRTTIALYGLGFPRVQGVDMSSGMIEQAISGANQRGYPIPFDIGDATRLRYGDEYFDGALFSAQGLMCIPGRDNRLRALREVRRVLKPGGFFFFTTHDRHWAREWKLFWEDERGRWEKGTQDSRVLEFGDRIVMDHGTPTFIHFPTREDVAKMVQEASFDLVEDPLRSEISIDTEAARRFNSNCRMWVVQRRC